MVSTPSPPTPPDPKVTAAAQTGMNIDTAQAQQLTNMTDQVTPYGSLTYSKGADRTYTDSSGKTVSIPGYTATQSLSPEQQKLFDLSNQTKQAISQIGLTQTQKIGDLLNTPIDLSDTSIDKSLYDQYSPRVIAQQNQQNGALQAQLAAQGVTPGSEAYNNAMRLQNQSNTDQWNQLYLGGRGQALQTMMAQRQEPINEISALMGGSQLTPPNFTQTPTSTVQPTDYIGAVNSNYQQQYQNYVAQLNSQNSMMGGIFGTLGSLAGGWASGGFAGLSDRRLKTAIRFIGRLANGLPLYRFKYLWDSADRIGLMAQDVARVKPHAIFKIGDFLAVNYSLAMEA